MLFPYQELETLCVISISGIGDIMFLFPYQELETLCFVPISGTLIIPSSEGLHPESVSPNLSILPQYLLQWWKLGPHL